MTHDSERKQQYLDAFAKAVKAIDVHPDILIPDEQDTMRPLKQVYAEAINIARTPELADWAADKLASYEIEGGETENFITSLTSGLNRKSDTLSEIDAARILMDTLNHVMSQKPKHGLS